MEIFMRQNNLILTNIFLFLILLLVSAGCTQSTEIEERNWNLVWQDEFNTDGPLDAAKWTYDLGAGGWGNNEFQTYTNNEENVVVDDGYLKLTALRSGTSFSSARIKTQGLFEQAYGRFEARIKTPYGPGIWPAFWLLGANIDTDPWPLCGEIDIMELRGQQPSLINGTVHGPGYSGGAAITKTYGLEASRFDSEFHLFAVEWGTDYLNFYVDDVLYFEIKPDDLTGEWVYDHPFFIILNIAVGGDYVGFPTSETPFPQTMLVDYVRVYKEAQ
jgi:beta-glucanase (GH16 family)